MLRPLLSAVVLLLGACADELPGHFYTLTLETAVDGGGNLKDDCQDPPEAVREQLVYRVLQNGPDWQVFVEDALLANGQFEGCNLLYQSAAWTERREDGPVRWAVAGAARVGLGSSCADGWEGTERLQVFDSGDPAVQPGCTVEFDVTGTYDGFVE